MDQTPQSEYANKVTPANTTSPQPARSRKKLLLASLAAVAVTLTTVGAGVALAPPASAKVTVDVDGKITTFESEAPTLAAALEERGVKLTATAVVKPALSTPLEDSVDASVRYLKPITVIADGREVVEELPVVNLEEALAALALTPDPGAYVSEELEPTLPVAGGYVVVSNPKKLTLMEDGKKRSMTTSALTVKDFLTEAKVRYDRNDELSKELTAYTTPGLAVKVVDVRVKETEEQKRTVLPVEIRKDATLLRGETEVVREGAPRVIKRIFRLTLADGKMRDRELLRTQVVSRGMGRLVLKGTAEPEPEPLPVPEVGDELSPEPQASMPLGGPVTAGSARALGLDMMLAAGFPQTQWGCLESLWTKESGWNYLAANPSSGAYGIPQSLPGSKMASAGADWRTNPATQIEWGLGYISARYGSPCGAWSHSQNVGWY